MRWKSATTTSWRIYIYIYIYIYIRCHYLLGFSFTLKLILHYPNFIMKLQFLTILFFYYTYASAFWWWPKPKPKPQPQPSVKPTPSPTPTPTPSPVKQIQLFAIGDGIDHLGLSYIHEGAGINYAQLGADAETLSFDKENGVIFQEVQGETPYNLTLSVVQNNENYKGFPFLQLSVTAPNVKWSSVQKEDKKFLKADGKSSFIAAKDVNDPYQYSKNSYFVGVGDVDLHKFDAKSIKILVKKV